MKEIFETVAQAVGQAVQDYYIQKAVAKPYTAEDRRLIKIVWGTIGVGIILIAAACFFHVL